MGSLRVAKASTQRTDFAAGAEFFAGDMVGQTVADQPTPRAEKMQRIRKSWHHDAGLVASMKSRAENSPGNTVPRNASGAERIRSQRCHPVIR